MNRKYKFNNKEGLYFVSFATVYWLDACLSCRKVFTRDHYCWAVMESLTYCRKHKGMENYAWCIMPSHVHLIFIAKDNNPGDLLRDLKSDTSKKIQRLIVENPQVEQKGMDDMDEETSWRKKQHYKRKAVWQQHNKPIELWSSEVINQKLDYIHLNPVESGFITEPHYWKYSSAIDYSGGKGLLEIDYV